MVNLCQFIIWERTPKKGSRERNSMALQKLFLTEKVHQERVGNSMSTTYCFDPKRETLTIFWKDQKVCQCKAQLGDAFVVNCNGSEPVVNKLRLPHKNSDLIMWLLSFSKECRTHSQEEFDQLLACQRKEYDWWAYRESEVTGENFRFVLCNRSDCGGVNHIAAFVSDDIGKKEALEMLKKYSEIRWIYYPESFVQKVLQDRFGISEQEFQEAALHF